jgi:outer membrane protein assembly factor BamB
MRAIPRSKLLAGLAAGLLVSSATADWTHFRGDFSGEAKGNPPAKLSKTENLAWRIDLPGKGLSGPIIVGDRIFLTSSSGNRDDRLHVLAYSVKDGSKLWERQTYCTGSTNCFPTICMATPTPASDGKRVFALYSCNDVVCYDLDGNLLWTRGLTNDYRNASNSIGMSSSPVVIDDVLVCQIENDAESFAVGLDVATGVNRWKVERPKNSVWSSPAAIPDGKGGKLAMLHSRDGVTALNPKTGATVWSMEGGGHPVVSTAVAGDRILLPFMKDGLTIVTPKADASPTKLWGEPGYRTATATPVVHQGKIYVVAGTGVTVIDLESGKRAWQLRLKGKFSSSPVAAGGRIYVGSEEGTLYSITPSDAKGEITAALELEDRVMGTPAIDGDALFVRTDKYLWKFAKK